mmetsp:Transcript_24571/g.42266  ORF Transcript_24571/g.42266 Transcript_24571/m.42266 type:complete len:294 (+) Transcript_24571:114-995(+)
MGMATQFGTKSRIRDVWADNLDEEMGLIRSLVEEYPYISMDTEFPGVVARPVGSFRSSDDYQYQTLRCNVDLLKIIQLGLSFSDADGNLPSGCCSWQFNFSFNLNEDMYAQDSIDLLRQSGLDFKKHEDRGIDVEYFGELLMTSGIVLNEDIRWISFHSGYDFGYLIKLLTAKALPAEETEFFDLLHMYFPCVYDVKYLMKFCGNMGGGLNKLAQSLEIERIGPCHQAGSDSLLTSLTFFELRRRFFETIDESKYMGILYGLGFGVQNSANFYSNSNFSQPLGTGPVSVEASS